ncbi:hypothetical protein HW555_001443 [Spodoptera exigua]|uniref:Uncharacterized protein n=1 Tax=Spodoptera exigua TaxID=7107 RepID=A0A835GS74_SPOEX|nr:hypothetical protein HW555_001443 [Spodoptera exigua]
MMPPLISGSHTKLFLGHKNCIRTSLALMNMGLHSWSLDPIPKIYTIFAQSNAVDKIIIFST